MKVLAIVLEKQQNDYMQFTFDVRKLWERKQENNGFVYGTNTGQNNKSYHLVAQLHAIRTTTPKRKQVGEALCFTFEEINKGN